MLSLLKILRKVRTLKITEYNIKTEKFASDDSLRIVQLSDLHKKKFGKNNINLTDRVRSLSPDVIFITGDMVSRSTTELESFITFLHTLADIAPVYYALGNHETDMENVNFPLYQKLIGEVNNTCVLVNNHTEKIKLKNSDVNVTGLTIFQECYKNNGSYKNLRNLFREDIINLLGTEPDSNSLNILLAHNPIFFDAYADYGSDIILSGHVHGGCIKLPFIGGLLSPERKFFPKYYSGLYKKKNSTMIVSCGLGKFRLFNPPEIIVINISS